MTKSSVSRDFTFEKFGSPSGLHTALFHKGAPSSPPKTLCPDFEWLKRYPDDLVERTMAELKRTFEARNHHPSEKQLSSLQLNASVIQAMAEGNPLLKRHFYLSSLAPGVGKTTLDIEAIRQLNDMPKYRDIGVLFLIARCEEIHSIVDAIGLVPADYAVLVSDRTENCEAIHGCGNPDPSAARVLFTTQAMLIKRLKHRHSFEVTEAFSFRGEPRQVRIWDEAILPSRIITMSLHQIKHLSKDLSRAGFLDVLKSLDKFEDALRSAKDQDIVQVPDLSSFNIGLEELRGAFDHEDDKAVVEDLWTLSGNCVRVRPDRANNVIVDYVDMFPADLGPMLVQDASGGLRKTYDLWRKDRGGLCYLPPAPKSYGGLTLHHWDHGAGRDIFKPGNKKGDKVICAIANAIRNIPADMPILVVHYRKKKYIRDIADEIQAKIGTRANVRFIHWGVHTATNDFQAFKHVILIGAYQYSVPANEAYGRSAKGIPSNVPLSRQEYDQVRLGEIKHNLYQAACRGNIRMSEGDGCPPGNHLYMIFSTHRTAGMPTAMLGEVFPGAEIVSWKPVDAPLSDKAQKLLQYLNAEVSETTITKARLKTLLDVTGPTLKRLLEAVKEPMSRGGRPITIGTRTVVIPAA